MKRTFRMELCRLVGEKSGQTTEALTEQLRTLYPGEGQVHKTGTHLQALRAVGIVRVCGEEFASEDHFSLVQHWELTASGRQRLEKMLA